MFGRTQRALVLIAVLSVTGCEEGAPTAPTTFQRVELSVAPDPLVAVPSTGVTVTVAGSTFDLPWKTSFALLMSLPENGTPVDIAILAVNVQQATGGIVVASAAGDDERFRFTPRPQANRIESGGEAVVEFDLWYLLPNGGREALVTLSASFDTPAGLTTSTVDVRVAP